MNTTITTKICLSTLLMGVCNFPLMASAQDANEAIKERATLSSAGAFVDEIIVTARKRSETSISVPVSVTAIGAAQIESGAINSLEDVASLVPSLTVSQVSGGAGGSIILRGLGTMAGSNPTFEQTVSVNVDGVQLSRGAVMRLGQTDMAQIEVLRGPQALFFGKNSPAGVISITTQDPTDAYESMGRLGYEFNAEEIIGDAVLSGPISDTLKARVAISASHMNGWVKNLAPSAAVAANALVPGAVNAPIDTGPRQDFIMGRGTLIWEPSDRFDLRTKLSYAEMDGPGFQQGPNQRIHCPNGAANVGFQARFLSSDPATRTALTQALAVDDCVANDTYAHGSINPDHLTTSTIGNDEEGEGKYQLLLGSIEANWDVSDALTLTSVTGLATIEQRRYDTYSYAPSSSFSGLTIGGETEWEQLSQELRLTSNFVDSPFDFLIGAFIEDSTLETYTMDIATVGRPRWDHTIDGSTYSVFGQVIYDISDTLELSGGARWTKEDRELVALRNDLVQPLDPGDLSFDNVSPEATLAWRPSDALTLFGSYREGFKSGGFSAGNINNAALTNAAPGRFSYEPEKVKGFELGMHASVLDHQLRLNGAVYDYAYSNLQVASLDNSTGLPIIRVANAAEASISGAEFDFTYHPDQTPDLNLRGSLNYSSAKFDEFAARCYVGQTVAAGCGLGLNTTTGRFQAQDLAGERLPNAPQWSGSFGVSYSPQLDYANLGLAITADAIYKSEYNPHPDLAPGAVQDDGLFFNSSLRLSPENDRWEIALIGKNLGDKYRVQSAANAPTTGSGALTGSTTTGGLADLVGYTNRGREVLLQLTVRPSNF